jgi:hypothetical protein
MSQATGISAASFMRIWCAFGLKPHFEKTFKLSTDPMFVDKVHETVGPSAVYRRESQIQALNRAQPGLPLASGKLVTHPRLQAPRNHIIVRGSGYRLG